MSARMPVVSLDSPIDRVLERSVDTTFRVGTNLKGGAAGAVWTLLLPTLELGAVLCVGCPAPASLATLGRLATRVVVVSQRGAQRRAARVIAGLPDPSAVELVTPDEFRDAASHDFQVGVVVGPALRIDPTVQTALESCAIVYVDGDGAPPIAHLSGPEAQRLWVAPRTGEPSAVAPMADERLVGFLRGTTTGARGPVIRRLVKQAVARRPTGERRTLLAGVPVGVPDYVRRMAETAGLELGGHRAALTAPGDYASRKAVLFLFPAEADTPSHVVKLTRDAAHNARLDNEWRALVALDDAHIGAEGTVPRPAFAGTHAGFAVVGETAVGGSSLLGRTTLRADCPLARGALDWLLAMGEASARRPQDNIAAAAALRDLHERFSAIYPLPADERRLLADQLDRLEHGPPLPLVFQHGDPGAWNVMVTPDGRPVLLDWEAFETAGMPLWDALYFMRSFGVRAAREAGIRNPLKGFGAQYLAPSPLAGTLAEALHAHRDAIGLAPEHVEPLFHTCWMHRALKEATRLPAARLSSGHYVNLLRLGLRRRDAPGLQALFAA